MVEEVDDLIEEAIDEAIEEASQATDTPAYSNDSNKTKNPQSSCKTQGTSSSAARQAGDSSRGIQ